MADNTTRTKPERILIESGKNKGQPDRKYAGVYKRCGKFIYIVKFKDAGGRWRQEWGGGFDTKTEALAARAAKVAEIRGGTHVQKSGRTVGAYMTEWLDGQINLKPTTAHGYRVQLRAHVIPGIGDVKLQDLTMTMLNRFYRELYQPSDPDRKPLSARSVELCHAVIRKALNDAVRAGELKVNPATHATLPRKQKPQLTAPWTAEQLDSFIESLGDNPLRAAFIVAAMTGARRGEVAGLRFMDLDLEGAWLHIRRPRTTINGKAVEDDPKNATSARSIDIDPMTVQALREHRDALMAQGFDRVAPDRCVFQEANGDGVDPNRLSREFKAAARRAGLPDVRFHDLRHTHATVLLQAKVPAEVVAERLGHSTPMVTLTISRHVARSEHTAAARVFAERVLGSRPGRAQAT
jgi:integrase